MAATMSRTGRAKNDLWNLSKNNKASILQANIVHIIKSFSSNRNASLKLTVCFDITVAVSFLLS